jgi:hypothetical protein
MWTIGRSQRVEEKKYRPIVRKLWYVFYRNTSFLLIDTTYVIQNVVSHTYVKQDVL